MISAPQTVDELNELASRPTDAVVKSLSDIESNILVVGAGGKMGFHLARMLQRALQDQESSGQVIAVSRFANPHSTELFDRHGIQTISVDLTKDGSLEGLPEAQCVFFLAGVKFGTDDNPQLLQTMNIELPKRIAARFANSQIVALSTGCVYPFTTRESGGSVETDSIGPVGDYAISCAGREQAFIESGVRVSLIRLNYSVDLRYGVLVDIARQVLTEQPVDVSTGCFNVIWQGDATAHTILSRPRADSPPRVFNVTGRQILDLRDVAEQFGQLFDKRVSFVGNEQPTAWLSNARHSHQLWGPPTIDETTLMRWVADWLQRGGPTLDKPTQFQVRDGKY